jgi:ATP-binding cassette subfamily B protein
MSRLLELAANEKPLIACSCVLAVLGAAVSFSPFLAIHGIIKELSSSLPDLSKLDAPLLTRLGLWSCAGAMAAVFLNFLALLFSHVAAYATLRKLKLDFATRVASLPLGFHSENPTGKLRKIADENIEKLETFIAHQLPDLAGSFATPVFTLVILFWFDWRLGLGSLVPILLSYGILVTAFGNEKSKMYLKKYQDSLEEMNNGAVEYVRGISVVKAFGQTVYSFGRFRETILNYGRFVKDYTMAFETHMVLFTVFINHAYLFVLPVILVLVGGVTDYPKFALASVFYLFFSVSLSTPFAKLLYVSQTGNQVVDGIARMDKILDVPPLPRTNDPKTPEGHAVEFKNVSFRYDRDGKKGGSRPLALKNLSFRAEPGNVTALVGPSGGGKSTAAHLIPRFHDVREGSIEIGGVDAREMDPDLLMAMVSFVFQDVFLFKKSIRENIRAGKKDASDAEVERAAELAQCAEFAEKLQGGLDAVVGKDTRLSGGERQRISIARAILKDSPILVLDEATAFADAENERKIQKALEVLAKDKTVIIIAHRLSTVRGADKIVVLENGSKIEEGRHGELMALGGRYRKMWESLEKSGFGQGKELT